MGCDITCVTQRRIDSRWIDAGPRYGLRGEREYEVFAMLAGVRGHGEPIAPPRGLPSGFEVDARGQRVQFARDDHEHWMGEHSFSWLTLSELFDRDETEGIPTSKFRGDFFTELVQWARDNGIESEDVRIVFGFNS